MDFDTTRDKLFPAALTPPGQGRSSAFGFHASTKPELAFPGAFRRLIGSFHGDKSWSIKGREG
jgi:hypothetical protein